MTAPVGSLTKPVKVPRTCADALGASQHNETSTRIRTCQLFRVHFNIVFPLTLRKTMFVFC